MVREETIKVDEKNLGVGNWKKGVGCGYRLSYMTHLFDF